MVKARKRKYRLVLALLGIALAVMLHGCGADMQSVAEKGTEEGQNIEGQLLEQLDLGKKYLLTGEYEEAIVAFNGAIELERRHLPAYTGLLWAYAGMGDAVHVEDIIRQGCEIISDTELSEDENEFLEACSDILADNASETEFSALAQELFVQYPDLFDDGFIEKTSIFLVIEDEIDHLDEIIELYEHNSMEELFGAILNNSSISELRSGNPGKIVYCGETKDLVPDGFGIAVYGDRITEHGILYVGDWRNGKRQGKGYNLFLDQFGGDGYYIGEWSDDLPNGEARIHVQRDDQTFDEITGTAKDGYPDGIFQCQFFRNTNISGYVYQCINGIPQSQGFGPVSNGKVEEDIMALMIEENGEKVPIWHTWAGLRCTECNPEAYDDMLDFLNAFDHSWAGYKDDEPKYSFLID